MIVLPNQNIWKVAQGCDAVVIPTNLVVKTDGTLVMGAGMALQAKRRYPHLPKTFGDWYGPPNSRTSDVFLDERSGCIAFPTKKHWRDKADVELIKSGCYSLCKLLEHNVELNQIVMPAVGCGLGWLSWTTVREILVEYFYMTNRIIVIEPVEEKSAPPV